MLQRYRLPMLIVPLLFVLVSSGLIALCQPLGARAASDVKVQYRGSGGATAQELTPWLRIVNTGSANVSLSELKVRYWFTRDSNATVNVACDWAVIGCGSITRTTGTLASPKPQADSYVELGFSSGTVNANSNTGEIQLRIYKSDWSTFTQSNDYSYDASKTAFVDWDHVTLYRNGQLVWGVEPGGNTGPTPTPTTPTPTPTTPTVTPIPTTPTVTPTPPPGNKKQVVGYFVQWGIYERQYYVKNLVTSGSMNTLTTINYAFGNISTSLRCYEENRAGWGDSWADYQRSFQASESVDGVGDTWDQPLKGNFNQLKKLKARYPNVKILISLGGWTWSGRFSDAALPANRAAFVKSCIDQYIKGNLPQIDGDPAGGNGAAAGIFDGIDIDWEYPAMPAFEGDPSRGIPPNTYRPEDTQNYTALLAEFRKQLDEIGAQNGKHYLLTAAVPSGVDKIEKIQVNSFSQYLDWVNVMTYDMHGAWDAQGPTNFQSPLYPSPNDPSTGVQKNYNIDFAIQQYLNGGVPAGKLLLGVPFYGRGWTNVPNQNNGLYQTSPNMQPAPGTYEQGIEDYKVLKKLAGYTSYRDPITHSYWLFNGSTFWTLDDPVALKDKINYLKSKGLGGLMAWEMDGDDGTLIQAIHEGISG
ncbi:GH18 family chitinase [Thermosporothrix hazakensis]|uniref:chitinase n=2 Tax=Thermosporothrix TaxID=768650 RepID=A0A326UDZ5_THEHA|nr:glycosyl hydrolase family 18 protein [Thermosporothrix hazakensis]PZW36516.1 GH18 family chitinase [Thermosporothrix hazakensis]BBH88982.1 hypothetical protein KTC_37330 [Thermosporothrix sp. COM3]GCE47168.1 hypothetical protein KTH_20370 [Thermosporothrix hazakensis]